LRQGLWSGPKRATTLYASDRDVFVFLVDDENPVQVRVDSTRHLFPGFMVWNSEVGHHKFGFLTFLYDFRLERAARMKVGSTDEEVLSWLKRHEFTKIIQTAKGEEGGARTVWELVNGGTALARAIPHNDDRVVLEKRVSGLLKAA
jgi:hypothetical protein